MSTPRFTPPVTEEQAARAAGRVGAAFAGALEAFRRAGEQLESPGPFAERLAEAMRPFSEAREQLRSRAGADAEDGAR